MLTSALHSTHIGMGKPDSTSIFNVTFGCLKYASPSNFCKKKNREKKKDNQAAAPSIIKEERLVANSTHTIDFKHNTIQSVESRSPPNIRTQSNSVQKGKFS
jgi:hypothetical protein